jgi:hypothetical protein
VIAQHAPQLLWECMFVTAPSDRQSIAAKYKNKKI